ncbi:hypothetical protein D5F01_LYC14049 [Larimichthys crocea]|uniref:Uncharacterized protein n=1 Tax=Larimichthys crocea TaxID=215358 RepID=A0A6G0I940_LARCR|nr:hypothetical protein D5F01_LYC14049 [Larimichthys crocea]
MTVPQRRLAGLWPWLLMAALQVVLGQPGLESERPALRAVIKVALLNHEPTGKPITLEGVFVGGSAGFAEGKLMQCAEVLQDALCCSLDLFQQVLAASAGCFTVPLYVPVFRWMSEGGEGWKGVSHKVLNASSSLPELSTVRGHYLHVSLAWPSAGRLGTRDGRAVGALRENIKVRPVPNVSWDD